MKIWYQELTVLEEASLFIKLVVDTDGTLSKAKRSRFAELDDELVGQLEAVVRKHMLER
ncbi:hypothetical protein NR798_03120 [Archangium gephyra]|uniref:hypothetical protein n=1 Tax=Archangium gephyra TaxID=48 RepID=UPI0035D46D43